MSQIYLEIFLFDFANIGELETGLDIQGGNEAEKKVIERMRGVDWASD